LAIDPKVLAQREEQNRADVCTYRRHEALSAVRTLINYIEHQGGMPSLAPLRPGCEETPERVLKAWEQDWGIGYRRLPPSMKTFEQEGTSYDQMVLVSDISFFSHCEHHLAPFFGRAHVAYIPTKEKGVVGISKLARIVDHFARRLQVQERLTQQVADALVAELSPDVAVLMSASHFCMVSRGVRQPESKTITSALRGEFYNNAQSRSEFLSLANAKS
jgi:GTP cyclohydrolase I